MWAIQVIYSLLRKATVFILKLGLGRLAAYIAINICILKRKIILSQNFGEFKDIVQPIKRGVRWVPIDSP